MDILLDKGQNHSGYKDLNYVARSEKIYIIDNHLAAIWCMSQIDLSRPLNLLNVDQHYDLVPYRPEHHEAIHNIDFRELPIEELTHYIYIFHGISLPLITWDNYLNLFHEKYPDAIENTTFVTQKVGTFNYQKQYEELEIYELFKKDFHGDHRWIFNIDLDFFFTRIEEDIIQMYSDEFISGFGRWLNEENDNIELIILCLSPECCGGWDEAKHVLNLILSELVPEN